jgi:ABC-2 type transport system permease protein
VSERDVLPPLKRSGPPPGAIRGTAYTVREVWRRRDLLWLLIRREIRSRYKDSTLGVLWSLIRPVTQLIIYYVAIGKFLGAERNVPQFAIFVFAGLTLWTFFSELITSTTASIVSNAGLVKKVYLPREIFPISALGAALFTFAVQFVILFAATVITGQGPWSWDILYLPLAVIAVLLFGFAIGTVLAAANVFKRDFQHLVEVAVVILFWASPIVYSYQLVHDVLQGSFLEELYLANPITLAVLGFQRAMWRAGADQLWPPDLALRLLIASVVCLLAVWVAQRVFARLDTNFAQEL